MAKDDNEYIKNAAFSLSTEQEIIKQAHEELSEDVEIESEIGKSADEVEVEEEDPDTALTSGFDQHVPEREEVKSGNEHIRERGYEKGEIDMDENDGLERMKSADSLQDKQAQILEANERFRSDNISRRYVMSKADIPKDAIAFKDALSHYYYKIDKPLAPEDCVKMLESYDTWFDVAKTDRPAVGIIALAEKYPWAFEDMRTSEKHDASVFLDNVFVSELDMTTEKRDVNEEFTEQQMKKMLELFDR